ncbi:thioredoxin-related transmembrane protein 2-like [Amphiura filiformis]|uniref:thioredoxin-related transmembrane protein 2-like n=1 Tax=Amphiura filiformis TaxID=82378 RepID=UPI003B215105
MRLMVDPWHYVSGFHISHLLLSISFTLLKNVRPLCTFVFEESDHQCSLDWNETNIYFFLICTLVVKNRKGPSFDELLKKIFLFSKVANFLLFFYSDLRLAILFSVACMVVVVTCPEPIYKGPQEITYFTHDTLQEELETRPRTTWLIELYTSWSAKCQELATPFAQISNTYSHTHLKFGKVDLGRQQETAKEYLIDTSATSSQLPTIILFQNGKEVMRKPGRTRRGVAKYSFTVDNIIRDFELQSLYESTKSKNQKKAEKKELKAKEEVEEIVPETEEEKKTK